MSFFARTENSILKFIRKHKVPKEPNQSWSKRAILEILLTLVGIPDFKLYYKAIVTKTTWYWHKKQTQRPVE
jgi:hypothetical protein